MAAYEKVDMKPRTSIAFILNDVGQTKQDPMKRAGDAYTDELLTQTTEDFSVQSSFHAFSSNPAQHSALVFVEGDASPHSSGSGYVTDARTTRYTPSLSPKSTPAYHHRTSHGEWKQPNYTAVNEVRRTASHGQASVVQTLRQPAWTPRDTDIAPYTDTAVNNVQSYVTWTEHDSRWPRQVRSMQGPVWWIFDDRGESAKLGSSRWGDAVPSASVRKRKRCAEAGDSDDPQPPKMRSKHLPAVDITGKATTIQRLRREPHIPGR